LESRGLSKRFGPVVALERVDVRVEPGTVSGLLGPNGAGKTTLLQVLLGLVRPEVGSTGASRSLPEEDRTPRLLAEVEVAPEVTEDRLVLADVGAGIGTPVRLGVDPGTA
jgi:ABC-type multidrug transport system ATPase subunit